METTNVCADAMITIGKAFLQNKVRNDLENAEEIRPLKKWL